MTRYLLFYIYLFILPAVAVAQQQAVTVPDSLAPDILDDIRNDTVFFIPKTRPLRQVAGAPQAFYTYFWEFGDGHFSFLEKPAHSYADTGYFDVRLYATNNYDDGKAPPKRSKKRRNEVLPNKTAPQQTAGFFNGNEQIQARVNRMPRPGEEMVYVAGYRNDMPGTKAFSGTLVFSYNEKSFKNKNFQLADVRTYHAEDSSSVEELLQQSGALACIPDEGNSYYASTGSESLLHAVNSTAIGTVADIVTEKQLLFSDQLSWHFENLAAGEERYFFLSLLTTPEMIRDTNAVVTLNMIMVPDDVTQEVTSMDYELQIVASHDPNKIGVSSRLMNYRFVGNKKSLRYKIRFQNTGKGPARKVDVAVAFSENADLDSIQIIGQYPECVPCKDAYEGQSCLDTIRAGTDSVHFIFKNIYLPGVQQDGVMDIDSTKGFVAFYTRLKGKPDKRPFYAQAAIVFDKNEPVITNRAWNRFLPGLSPAVIAGYNLIGLDSNRPSGGGFILGAGIAPFSPFRFYPQFEVYLGINLKTSLDRTDTRTRPENEKDLLFIQEADQTRSLWYRSGIRYYEEQTRYTIDLVPVHIRRNFNKWIGAGVGIWLSGYLSQQSHIQTDTLFTEYYDQIRMFERSETSETKIKALTKANAAGFLDLNIGLARVGPALGLRYLHFIGPQQGRLMLYATWRL